MNKKNITLTALAAVLTVLAFCLFAMIVWHWATTGGEIFPSVPDDYLNVSPPAEQDMPEQKETAKPAAEQNPLAATSETPPADREIILENIVTGTTVSSPREIRGQAKGSWYFEAIFPVRLLDGNGREISLTQANAQSDWMTDDWVKFKATLDFLPPETKEGTLILQNDNPSGLPENDRRVEIPIKFGEAKTETVSVFFSNDKLDPQISCQKVFPLTKKIAIFQGQHPVRAAIEELLRGISDAEKSDGYFTAINEGVKIQKLTVADGAASVDFNDQLEFQVGGSCRVTAIRAQIEETLKQFPDVKQVIISVNGRTEDILQP